MDKNSHTEIKFHGGGVIFQGRGCNFPRRNFLGGGAIFLGGNFSGGNFLGVIFWGIFFRGAFFPGGIFPRTS